MVLLPDSGRGYLSQDLQRRVDGRLRLPHARRRPADGRRRAAPQGRGQGPAARRSCTSHPEETVGSAIAILREYGVSQMPVVKEEPPVMAAEVVGAVVERDLLDAVFADRAALDRPAVAST